MEAHTFLSGLTPLQQRLLDVARAMGADEKVFIPATDLLNAVALKDLKIDEETFEEECEALNCEVFPMSEYPKESVGYLYRVMLRMGLLWRNRYPLFNLSGMIGDFHDEIPFGPESVELRLTLHAQLLFPTNKNPLLPLSLLNGVSLSDGAEIPPHNLEELWMAMEHLRQDPDLNLTDLMEVLPGPDFAPGGIVGGIDAIRALYEKGEAHLTLRGRIDTEIEGGRTRVIIRALPHGVLTGTILKQIRKLSHEEAFPLYTLKNTSEGTKIHIVLDISPKISSDQLKTVLYRETDLERVVLFRCGFKDQAGWSVEGPLIRVLKEALVQCSSGWKQKDGKSIDFVPFIRELMDHGGYKNPLTRLTDARRTAILKINPS